MYNMIETALCYNEISVNDDNFKKGAQSKSNRDVKKQKKNTSTFFVATVCSDNFCLYKWFGR